MDGRNLNIATNYQEHLNIVNSLLHLDNGGAGFVIAEHFVMYMLLSKT